MTAKTAAAKTQEVADFYGQLVFPSRTSHPEYADLVPKTMGQQVGDFGCGQSIFYEALRGYAPAPVFLDLSMRALETLDYGSRVRANLFTLPFPNERFDRLFCVGVLHHLPEPQGAFDELARVLKRNGTLVVGVYAPGSVQSRLRSLYMASGNRAWRRALFALTERLIRAKHARTGRTLSDDDARARAADFLDVPFVRYVAPEFFAQLAHKAGLRLRETRRISGMNLLILEPAVH